jgi:LysM repeat protein
MIRISRGFPTCIAMLTRRWLRVIGAVVVAILLFRVGGLALAQGETGATTVHIVAWGETLSVIAGRYGVGLEALIRANGLAEPDHIYAGQRLVIPDPVAAPAGGGGVYTVQPGDNLYRIGAAHGVSVDALIRANSLPGGGNQVYAGQRLIIPAAGEAGQAALPQEAGATHVVRSGETLSGISRMYGVSLSALITVNHLLNPSAIFPGQQLIIPGSATASGPGYSPQGTTATHVVQAGETLSSIAARYGTTAWVLAQANNLSNPSLVYSGQTLTIPAEGSLTAAAPPATTSKSIVVDVSDQRTYVYENGQLIWTFVVSTGMPGSGTLRGNFQIQNKIPMAYASTWDLQMPYWLGFYWAGSLQNGFHALPILSNGVRLWEGLLGRPASYGCVILSDHDARLLYEWAEVGTPVTVRN